MNTLGEPLRGGIVMYPETEVLIKLSPNSSCCLYGYRSKR